MTCCKRSGNFCTIVTGFLVVRLTPYMGAVVLNVVLHRREGVPPVGGVQVLASALLEGESSSAGFSVEEVELSEARKKTKNKCEDGETIF